MRKALFYLIFPLFLLPLPAIGGGIYISRYIPGDYLADNRHLVEIYNPNPHPVNLSGYLLITRDYSMRMPRGTTISPNSTFRIGKRSTANLPLNLNLKKTKDFLIRFHDREIDGNYIVLLSSSRKMVDAMYFSPTPQVPFLPVRDTLITFQRKKIPYYLPSENKSSWSHISMGDDPAIFFIQVDGNWQVTARNRNLNPATHYRGLSARYFEGIASLKWATSFEDNCREHVVERSEDQENFLPIGKVEAAGNGNVIRQYEFYDTDIQKGKKYYYRIRNEDKFSNIIYSRVREVATEEGPEEFIIEVLPPGQAGRNDLSIRFFSRYSQQIRIKILDEERQEVAILFDDYVYAESRNLLKVGKSLPKGEYILLADTETKRFWEVFRLD